MNYTKEKEYGPENWEETLGRLVSGIIIGGLKIILSIFRTIFKILSNLA